MTPRFMALRAFRPLGRLTRRSARGAMATASVYRLSVNQASPQRMVMSLLVLLFCVHGVTVMAVAGPDSAIQVTARDAFASSRRTLR
jgi:hypothetical protein